MNMALYRSTFPAKHDGRKRGGSEIIRWFFEDSADFLKLSRAQNLPQGDCPRYPGLRIAKGIAEGAINGDDLQSRIYFAGR